MSHLRYEDEEPIKTAAKKVLPRRRFSTASMVGPKGDVAGPQTKTADMPLFHALMNDIGWNSVETPKVKD